MLAKKDYVDLTQTEADITAAIAEEVADKYECFEEYAENFPDVSKDGHVVSSAFLGKSEVHPKLI